LDDWLPYQTFEADVTVSRSCLVGFTAFQEKSQRGEGYDRSISRWTKTAFLSPGTTTVSASIPQPDRAKWGKVVRFEIFMYRPHEGESIYVDNIRLKTAKLAKSNLQVRFKVIGADGEEVLGDAPDTTNPSTKAVQELAAKFKDRWTMPEEKSVAQIEEEFAAEFTRLKASHPKAVLVTLRDGEKGCNPAQPEKIYAGWMDAYINSHGPDGNTVARARNTGKSSTQEIFMRHRSPLMRVDLSGIPAGSNILAARLLVVRSSSGGKQNHPGQPNYWVAEPCNRAWDEQEVNAYQYAKDQFWKAIGGYCWDKDPDFLPLFFALGPGQPNVNHWDFTEAVRYWTSGEHPNHGFMLHGDSKDYMIAYSREAAEIKNRPAILVIYEPKSSTF
jgi:hypothetical protein